MEYRCNDIGHQRLDDDEITGKKSTCQHFLTLVPGQYIPDGDTKALDGNGSIKEDSCLRECDLGNSEKRTSPVWGSLCTASEQIQAKAASRPRECACDHSWDDTRGRHGLEERYAT